MTRTNSSPLLSYTLSKIADNGAKVKKNIVFLVFFSCNSLMLKKTSMLKNLKIFFYVVAMASRRQVILHT